MSPTRSFLAIFAASCLAIPSTFVVAASDARPGAGASAGAIAPAVELVASVPVESAIGDPTLPQAADVWVKMIDSARATLDLEHFYLSDWPGEPTGPVLDAIGRAARRGVRVRILLDVHFRSTYPQPAESLGTLPGIELRWLDMKNVSGHGVQHAKFMVVDDREMFVGSQNLDWRALKHIHELGARVRDPRISDVYRSVFEADWQAAAGAAPPARELPEATRAAFPVRLVQQPGDTVEVVPTFSPRGHIPDPSLWDLDHIVRLLDSAREEVVVQALSYGLGRGADRDSTLDQALRRAAARGVRIRLLISDWEADNARIGDLQRLAEVPGIEAKLSSVPDWSGGYIPFARVEHCKYMVVDTVWTWICTSNWEPDYFFASRNAGLVLHNHALASTARRVFETGWRSPTARAVRAGETYTPRIHRDTPPPGRKVYGS